MTKITDQPIMPVREDKAAPDMRFVSGCYFNGPTGQCIAVIPAACQCSKMHAAGIRWKWTRYGMRLSWNEGEQEPQYDEALERS